MKLLKLKNMPKTVSFATAILILILGCVVANQFGIAGSNFLFFLPQNGGDRATDAGAVSVSFDDINELASERLEGDYIYELTDDGAKVLGIKIPLTGKSALLEYRGEAKAGIKDAGEIKWEANDAKKTITVTCPEVEVLDCNTSPRKIWKTDGSIINHYTFSDYPGVDAATEKAFKKVVKKSDLLKRAKQSTRANLINLFHEQASKDSVYGNYKVVVKWGSDTTKE